MKIKVRLVNSCLNCEMEIPMEYELCSTKCLNELRECASASGVKGKDFNYKKDEVWKP